NQRRGVVKILIMRARLLVFIGGGGILFATVLLFHFGREVAHQRALNHPTLPSIATTPVTAMTPGSVPTSSVGPGTSTGSTPNDPGLQKWLEDEGKNVEKPNVDSGRAMERVDEVVAHLTPAQAAQLRATVLNASAPGS